MMEQKKNKSLIIGIIAAVVILAVLLALVLTQCTGDTGGQVTTAPAETQEEIPTYTLYWNPDRELYAGKTEAGLSSRVPENDGYFHIRFLCNGEEITLQTQDRQLVNMIDTRDLMGLEFDEDGYIIGVVDPRDMPLEMPGYLFFVQSVGGNVIKVNSSDAFDGMDILLEATENTGIWDMTGISGPEGVDAEPIVFDRLICVQNMAGELTHVYIIERSNYFLTHEAECQHCKETVTWYEWTRETDLPTRSGHYQLMKDVQLESQHSMKAKVALCLDLNGHTIDGMRNARVISLQKTETELALMDTSEEKTGKIAGHGTTGQGGVIWVRNGNFYMYGGTLDASDVIGTNGVVSMVDSNRYFYLYDGTIIGGIARAQAMETTASGFGYGAGGALYIRGTMRMYGGTIRDGRAKAGYNYKNGKLTVNRGIGGNIFLNSGAEFEIQDGQILNGYAGNMGGNIYADGTAEIIISGGNISGGRNDSRVKGRHGGNIVTATKTTVQMSGGTISGGVNPTGAGGNLNLNGTMTMTGGVITGGRGTDGGNVHMGNRAVLNMYGGVISGGCAENYGGNVNVSGQSTLCLQGGAILGGVADNSGGNINCFSEGTFRMTAGTLSDGVAKGEAAGNGGGNIYLRADKTKVEISGGTISGGKAEGAVAEDGTVTGGYGGNINISRGIVNISGGVITGGEANGYAGGIYVGTKSSGMTLSGNARIYGNGIDIVRSTSNTAGKSQIVIDGWKGNGDKGKLVIDRIKGVAGSVLAIPVEGEALTDETLELFDSARRFLPLGINDKGQMILAKRLEMGEADHVHCLCGGAIKDHGCADTGFISVTAAEFMECFSYHDSAYYALGNANLCLTEDIELNAPCFSAGFELNICLNGHKITATKNGRLTSNGTTGVMNLADCTGKGSVVADSSCTTSLMTTYKGVLNIYGGTYDASAIKLDMTKDNSVGAAVAVREETDSFTLYGGKIIGGEANRGGAVYAYKGSVKICGGEITGGIARNGGNVAVNYGSFEMLGGKIYGGKADSGAGVHIGANASVKTLLLSGDAMIYGNGTEDVYLGSATGSDNYLTLDGWNGNGENAALKLNCRAAGIGSVVAVAKEGVLTEEDLAKLSYISDTLTAELKDGKIVLTYVTDHEHCLCNDTMEHTCEKVRYMKIATAEEFKALFDKDNFLLGDTNVVLTGDITLDSQYFCDGHVLNLCLNGHTITMTEKARLTANKISGVLNITDCGEEGKLLAAEGCRETLVNTNSGIVNLYGGIIDASAIRLGTEGSTVGAAVSIGQAVDQFNMYGGKLVGGQVSRGGTLYIYKGSAKIYGGEITGGEAANGGNVSVNYGSLEVFGGEIYGGKADSGAGVHIGANASVKTLLLSGDAMIYGNGTEDVYLGSATAAHNYLTLDGWKGNGENGALVLGCRGAAADSVVAIAKEGQLTEETLQLLSYPHDQLKLALKDGKAVLVPIFEHEHCICNGQLDHTCADISFASVATAEEFKNLFDEDCYLLADANVVLTGDITLDSQYFCDGHVWNLCLNGHTITMTEKARLTANKISGVLNITDCGEEGKLLAAEGCRETLVNTNSGIVNLYGGIIDASAIRLGTEGSTVGAAVSIGQAVDQFNMYGGKLVGGQVSRGGTLYIYKGSAKIYGGEITGGEAANGGNVSVNYGSLEVLGGEIYGGKADSGAGVHIGANASVKTLLLSGDAMIYCNGTEDVYLGSATAAHNYLTLDGWKGNGENGALVLGCRGAAADSVVAVAKEGELTQADAAKIIYSDENLISELAEGKLVLRAYHRHCLCANTLQEGCDHSKLIFTEIASADAFLEAVLAEGTETVNIVLTESFTLTGSQYIKGKTVNLCLNGQTLTMSGAKLIEQDGAVLNITTCNGGEITAGTTTSRQMLYAYTGGGTVNLYAGTINASKINTSGTGAAVQVKNNSTKEPISTFNMYGGTIIGAKAVERGTVYVDSGRFRMYGGEIKNGHATNGGGGVCVRTGHAELMGGIITGCSTNAANLGGGVCMLIESDSLTLSGNMKIYGNTSAGNPDDVYVGNKNKSAFYMVMDNWAGNGVDANGDPVKLYVSVHKDKKAGDVVAQAKSGSLTAAQLDMLEASGDVFMLALKDGKMVLADGHAHCLCNGTQEHTCTELTFRKVGSADAFKAFFGGDNKLMADTNMVLTADLTLDASYASGGHVWNLCLNGFSITLTNGGKLAEDCKVINCALADSVTQQVDLIMFMGQSNMAGRGDATQSVTVPAGYGYEFRAISDPTKLYPITEPFGVNENNVQSGVTETSKTGSMVSAFVKAYYEANQIPVVAVSCSKGGTGLEFWKVNGNALNDAVARHEAAKNWLHANAYTVGNDFMVWCQGETDGGDGMSAENYANGLKGIIEEMITETGIDFCAVVRIGNARNDAARHAQIIKAQTQLCKSYDKAVLVSAKLAGYGADMMKDAYHYLQAAYNEVGADAGTNAASYVKTGIEPSMKDPQYNNNYPADDIPEEENVNALEFTFDSETENGLRLSAIGTVADGALTVTDATNGSKNGILLPADKQFTISPDKSFTLEFVTTGTEGVVLLGSGSSTGGFVYFSPAGASKLRLRFDSSSKQFDATTQAVSATAKTHIAIVYDADTKTLSMYQDGKALTVKGNMSNFGTISFTTLCGGYKHNVETYAYAGQLHYFRYIDQALTVEEFHKES